MTRAELETLQADLRKAAESSSYSDALREQARAQAALIQNRLDQGDFHVGDEIALSVEGSLASTESSAIEGALTDTFTVNANGALTLPQIGDVSLHGVLHSELEPYLREQISRYIRNPNVRAQSLLRVSVLGEVGTPGFFTVPTTALLTEVLMQVGGPTHDADLDKMRIERGKTVIWEPKALAQAVRDGRTLDQLSLQAGDEIMIPEKKHFSLQSLRTLLYIVPAAVSLAALIFH